MPITRGTLILEESPLFIIPRGQDTAARINHEVANLSIENRQEYQLLTTTHQFLSRPDEINRGRFITNALPCGRDAGLFLYGARFNNSCKPNIHCVWNAPTSTMQFRAMRDILPGEELCIAYDVLGLLNPRSIRLANIQRTSGFRCICPSCIQPPRTDVAGTQMAIISDNTRGWLRNMILGNTDPTRGDLGANLQNISDALQALDREGLYHYRDTLFYDGHKVCVAAGDGVHAIQWLRRAYDSAVAVVGTQDQQVIDMWNLLNTRTAASYGTRNTMIPPPALSQ